MARMKLKTEGGQGGKRGHSNMVHYAKTADIKEAANRHRRVEAKQIVRSDIATLVDCGDDLPPSIAYLDESAQAP